jgi:hypothetical protein
LSQVILLGRGPATLAWTQRSAKSSLKFGEVVATHQWSPYGLTLRERGNSFRVCWQIQQFRETFDAFKPGRTVTKPSPWRRSRAGVLGQDQSVGVAASFTLTGFKAT